jgi:hypothetical protein
MILTIVNQLAVPLAIGYPVNRTLTENGGSYDTFVGGVSMADLLEGDVPQGDAAYKRLNLLEQEGQIAMSIAVDANDTNILDEANEL